MKLLGGPPFPVLIVLSSYFTGKIQGDVVPGNDEKDPFLTFDGMFIVGRAPAQQPYAWMYQPDPQPHPESPKVWSRFYRFL